MIVFKHLIFGWHRPTLALAGVLAACLLLTGSVLAQDSFSDADPVKLFEQGQNAHARAEVAKASEEKTENYNRAIEFYDEALKVKPEFAEAEYQRANALTSLGRFADAEAGYRRAIVLRNNWTLPYSGLASLLIRLNRDTEAQPLLLQSIRLDAHNAVALQQLAGLLLKANDFNGALKYAKQATAENEANATSWFIRALAERGSGDKTSAVSSLNHVLEIDPNNLQALLERGELNLAIGARDLAIKDLKSAEAFKDIDKRSLARIAQVYENAGMHEDAARAGGAAGVSPTVASGSNDVVGTPEEINQANSDDPAQARTALETLLKKNPNNATLLARLGAAYRTDDPNRSTFYYHRALEIEPANEDFATGYGSALVQSRRFGEAVLLLRKVVQASPDNYVAHANLATALYEMKRFAEALAEYEWLLKAKPDLSVTHYFIATAHDNLGEYKEALASYELFLAQANPAKNQLEMEKVKLRLPSLRRQIEKGQGAKEKSARSSKN